MNQIDQKNKKYFLRGNLTVKQMEQTKNWLKENFEQFVFSYSGIFRVLDIVIFI